MRKDIKTLLEQNNFVYENRDFIEYVPGNFYSYGCWISEYHKIFYRQYKYFQVMLFVAPHYDKRFPPQKNEVICSVQH